MSKGQVIGGNNTGNLGGIFWALDNKYIDYDNFDDYSVDETPDTDYWTTYTNAEGGATVYIKAVLDTEMWMKCYTLKGSLGGDTGAVAQIYSNAIPVGKSIHFIWKGGWSGGSSQGGSYQVQVNETTYFTRGGENDNNTDYGDLLVLYKSPNIYDVYINGQLQGENIDVTSVGIRCNGAGSSSGGSAWIEMRQVRYSK